MSPYSNGNGATHRYSLGWEKHRKPIQKKLQSSQTDRLLTNPPYNTQPIFERERRYSLRIGTDKARLTDFIYPEPPSYSRAWTPSWGPEACLVEFHATSFGTWCCPRATQWRALLAQRGSLLADARWPPRSGGGRCTLALSGLRKALHNLT